MRKVIFHMHIIPCFDMQYMGFILKHYRKYAYMALQWSGIGGYDNGSCISLSIPHNCSNDSLLL